ncbi:MAG: hypothetical protein OXI33_17520 [Chloroflexota bacterium]|nr:hypothetical protein [Chloroflexota bacterium]
MTVQRLTFALSDPDDSRPGGLVPEIVTALTGIQDAVRLMVQHLGDREKGPGQPPKWIREQSTLRLVDVRPGSLIADLEVEAPTDDQPYLEDFGSRAIETLQEWDGTQASTLPKDVEDTLRSTASKLSNGVRLSFGSRDNPHRVEIPRRPSTARKTSGLTEALLQGWLYEVNWDKGTAQLHDYSGEYVQLRFSEEFNQDMLRLATQRVEVRGRGRFNDSDRWTTVEVQQINATGSWSDAFDVETFLNDPNPKVFNPETVVTTSEPFDVDEFIRGIREGRDVQRERSG